MWTLLPSIVGWPRDASDAFFEAVRAKYLSASAPANRFVYSILLHRAESPRDAITALQAEGMNCSSKSEHLGTARNS